MLLFIKMTAYKFRKAFGFSNMRSSRFSCTLKGNKVSIVGHGFGHGVGMCQYGTQGMASAGKKYGEIIRYYFPDTSIGLLP